MWDLLTEEQTLLSVDFGQALGSQCWKNQYPKLLQDLVFWYLWHSQRTLILHLRKVLESTVDMALSPLIRCRVFGSSGSLHFYFGENLVSPWSFHIEGSEEPRGRTVGCVGFSRRLPALDEFLVIFRDE